MPTVLYFKGKFLICNCKKLENGKILDWKLEKICKSTAQPMENQVLTFFFIFGGQHGKILLVDIVASKKKKVNTWFSMGWAVLLQIFSNFFACPTHVAFAYGENEFMLLQMKGLVWGTGQALLRSPRGRNASRDGLVKLGWVHCLQYTLNCFQYNVCGLCRCEPSNHSLTLHNDIWKSSISIGLKACMFKSSLLSHHSWSAVYCN